MRRPHDPCNPNPTHTPSRPEAYTGTPPVIWPAKVNQIPREVFGDAAVFEEEPKKIFYGDFSKFCKVP